MFVCKPFSNIIHTNDTVESVAPGRDFYHIGRKSVPLLTNVR